MPSAYADVWTGIIHGYTMDTADYSSPNLYDAAKVPEADNATITSAPIVDGLINQSINFNGASTEILGFTASTGLYDTASDWFVSWWENETVDDGAGAQIYANMKSSGGRSQIVERWDLDKLDMQGATTFAINWTITTGWRHVIVSWDSALSNITVYVNGTKSASGSYNPYAAGGGSVIG